MKEVFDELVRKFVAAPTSQNISVGILSEARNLLSVILAKTGSQRPYACERRKKKRHWIPDY